MAESSLSLAKKHLEAEVGSFLGYSRGDDPEFGETTWTTPQRNNVAQCVKAGLRQFYFPPVSQTAGQSYTWSFLTPTATIAVADGLETVNLPDDFGGFVSPLTIQEAGISNWGPIPLVGEGNLRQARMLNPSASGRPLMAAVVPLKGVTTLHGQRFQLDVFPLPGADYTLKGEYAILPDCLTGAAPWCYGGGEHSETILESCLSQAELKLDDQAGIHAAKFAQCLATSISMDRRKKPQAVGYNGDPSDWRRGRTGNMWRGYGPLLNGYVTVSGIQY